MIFEPQHNRPGFSCHQEYWQRAPPSCTAPLPTCLHFRSCQGAATTAGATAAGATATGAAAAAAAWRHEAGEQRQQAAERRGGGGEHGGHQQQHRGQGEQQYNLSLGALGCNLSAWV